MQVTTNRFTLVLVKIDTANTFIAGEKTFRDQGIATNIQKVDQDCNTIHIFIFYSF